MEQIIFYVTKADVVATTSAFVLLTQSSAFFLNDGVFQLLEQRTRLIQLRARLQVAGFPLQTFNRLIAQHLMRADGVGHVFGVLLAEERSFVAEESVQAFGGERDERREHDLQ